MPLFLLCPLLLNVLSAGFHISRSSASFKNSWDTTSSEEANLTSAIGSSLFLPRICLFLLSKDLFLVQLELFTCILSPHLDCNFELRSCGFSPCPHSADVVPKAVPYTSERLRKTSVQCTIFKESFCAVQIPNIKL